jgi:hypothetical protein
MLSMPPKDSIYSTGLQHSDGDPNPHIRRVDPHAKIPRESYVGFTSVEHPCIVILAALGNNVSIQSNFHDYRPMRINEAPVVETHVVRSCEPPGGVGEVPTATVGPAVANAVFAATGKRIRRLPINAAE